MINFKFLFLARSVRYSTLEGSEPLDREAQANWNFPNALRFSLGDRMVADRLRNCVYNRQCVR